MAITRDSTHKRRETGGRRHPHKKKCKFETGRQGANTKMGAPRIRTVRCMGGNQKFRALRLDAGNFSWGSEAATRKTRILDVMYNASNNELVRTKTLVKNAIIAVDATPFRAYYETHYGVKLGKAKEGETDVKKSEHVQRKLTIRNKDRVLDPKIQEQFDSGRLLACISSRPGQSGRADGYILEGRELEFYQKQILKRKGKKGEKAAAASA